MKGERKVIKTWNPSSGNYKFVIKDDIYIYDHIREQIVNSTMCSTDNMLLLLGDRQIFTQYRDSEKIPKVNDI